MVLSDATIARLIEEGRIEVDPFDAALIQPSSVDVRVDRYFRVFRNNRAPYIDVKVEQDLTELVEIEGDEPFILHPGEFVLGSTLERVRLPDDLVARLEGKALALDTEVPTPSGWTTMGELSVGDLVFTDDGEPTVVVAATEPMLARPCREVRFSDGASVICDADHRWVTVSATSGLPERVVTTDEIASSLTVAGEPDHLVVVSPRLAASPALAQAVPDTVKATVPDTVKTTVPGTVKATVPGTCASATATLPAVEPARAITDVVEVPSVPVRCIEVSSARGVFLVTRAYVPTHNSSLGRLGLLIHSTAGFIDPGFDGHVTLELSNVANLPITIYHGMKIGQVSFMELSEPASAPYGTGTLGSKYQGQRGPTPSRYWQNFQDTK